MPIIKYASINEKAAKTHYTYDPGAMVTFSSPFTLKCLKCEEKSESIAMLVSHTIELSEELKQIQECSTCGRNLSTIHQLSESNAALTTKLKECRLILRAHGLGHAYPGVDNGYEDNQAMFAGTPQAYWHLQYAHQELMKENGIELTIYSRVIKVINFWRRIKKACLRR